MLLSEILKLMTSAQIQAVDWREGAALVLAGPGAGKTQVLTARMAKLLDESRNRKFRLLALTFTNKAGDEMKQRLEKFVPGLEDRATVGTFHSFCAQILRQHGSHIGIQPDFGMYSLDADRKALLEEALATARRNGKDVILDDVRFLSSIDRLKSRLITPQRTANQFRDADEGARAAQVYAIYEQALRDQNLMDFNGLVLEVCRLSTKVPAVATRIQQSYPYWLIDEFQDTTPAQYHLVKILAGSEFRNVFAVADDDQIIYQWNGASYKQIERFRNDFRPTLIQIPENHRCPPEVVVAGNRLVAYNTSRTPEKLPLIPTKPQSEPPIELRVFQNEVKEAEGLASEISKLEESVWPRLAVLGRTRSMLQPLCDALQKHDVAFLLVQRRDSFLSPQFVWLQSCLESLVRPLDRRLFTLLVDSSNRFTDLTLDAALLIAEAEASSRSFLEQWILSMPDGTGKHTTQLTRFANDLVRSRTRWKTIVAGAVEYFGHCANTPDGVISDLADDHAAWDARTREIKRELGTEPSLAEFLQGMALRTKEPPANPNAVTLMTIHSAKGLEFDVVYIIGFAESVIPSWQSIQKGPASAEMEEERRNCFVAITRTRERLILSRAEKYRGYPKSPSRFLLEMGLK